MSEGSHPGLERLSDFSAGVLSPTEAGPLEEHLQHCPSCLAHLESLDEVRGALRMAADQPSAMPTEVTARLTAALRDEARRHIDADLEPGELPSVGDRDARHLARGTRPTRADTPGFTGPGGNGRSGRAAGGRDGKAGVRRPGQRGRVRSRLVRGLAVAAGVAVLAAGGTVAYQEFLQTPEQPPVAVDPREDRGRPADSHRDRGYALSDRSLDLTERDFDDKVGEAVAPRAGGAPKADPGTTDGPGVTDPESAAPDSSGPDSSGPPETKSGPDGNAGITIRPDRCVQQALRRHTDQPGGQTSDIGQVLDTKDARFDGQPAMLVITTGSGAGSVHAWAITGCPASGSVAYDAEIPVRR